MNLSLPCIHEGCEATRFDREGGKFASRRRWLHCRSQTQPYGPIVTTAGGCGPTCPAYQPDTNAQIEGLAPLWTKRLDLPADLLTRSFNGSLLRWEGYWLLAYRHGPRCLVARLSEDWGVIRIVVVESARGRGILHERCHLRQEDPRLWVHDGRLFMSFVGVDVRGKDDGVDGLGAHILYTELDENFRAIRAYYPHYEGRHIWEKNWGFFSHDGDLYAVYSIKPHTILKIEGDHARKVYETETPHAWTGGHLRGGAPPVRIRGHYWNWFHGRIGVGADAIYNTGVYAFDAKPPFAVAQMTPAPLQWADPDSRPKGDRSASVVFVAGATYNESAGQWITSQGIHDDHVTVSEWDARSVADRLEEPAMSLPPVYALYCEELPDRKKGIADEMRRSGLNYTPWRSYHGKTWGLQTSKIYTQGECPITPGHAGLILGHYSLWQHLLASGVEEAIICEDDAVLCDGFDQKAAYVLRRRPADAQLIFLGHVGIPAGAPREQVSPGLVKCDHVFGTHCYWVHRSALPVLLSKMNELRSHIDLQMIENVLRPKLLNWYMADPCLSDQHSARGSWPGSCGGGTGWLGITQDVRDELNHAARTLEGWCPDHKARQMCALILTNKPAVVVEIGVFGGKSLIPQAIACRKNSHGLVYAIDPWTNEAAMESYPQDDPNLNWWSQQNLDKVCAQFCAYVNDQGLAPWVRIVRKRAEDCLDLFGPDNPIDVLHIDGNHSTETAIRDVKNYLPRVREGGWVWMDDVNWDTVKPACALVDLCCRVVFDCADQHGAAWRLYRKGY